MASKDEIKKALLDAAGNPESGPVASVIDDMVKAVMKVVSPEAPVSFDKSDREVQTIKPLEKR